MQRCLRALPRCSRKWLEAGRGEVTITATFPSARSIQRAIGVLERLPATALADLAERIIHRLDTVTPDPDLEPEEDDDDDAEELPPPGTLRPERDGLVRVWRRPAPESPA